MTGARKIKVLRGAGDINTYFFNEILKKFLMMTFKVLANVLGLTSLTFFFE